MCSSDLEREGRRGRSDEQMEKEWLSARQASCALLSNRCCPVRQEVGAGCEMEETERNREENTEKGERQLQKGVERRDGSKTVK